MRNLLLIMRVVLVVTYGIQTVRSEKPFERALYLLTAIAWVVVIALELAPNPVTNITIKSVGDTVNAVRR